MVAEIATVRHHLISRDGKILYTFYPRQDGDTKVVKTFSKAVHEYVVPRDEARQLYRRLLKKNYLPW